MKKKMFDIMNTFHHISIKTGLYELDLASAERKAAYAQIKTYHGKPAKNSSLRHRRW